MKIFLIGFMGCGKTTLGTKLAAKLTYEFIDLDKVIEARARTTIAGYFEKFGELKFREFERDTLQRFNYPENIIIATGGGAPCFFDNMEWMNKNGKTIYLSLPPKALASRLKNAKEKRPLIKDLDEDGLIRFITTKLEEREPFYKKAQLIIDGIGLTAEKIVEVLHYQNQLK